MTVSTGRRGRSALIALVVVLVTGCIGATDRSEFDAEIRRRGGGVTAEWIGSSLETAATELGVGDASQIEVLTLSVNPSNRSLTIQGRRGDRPDFVDSVTLVDAEVVDVTPMQDADDLPIDDLVVALSELPLDRVEELSDAAVEALGESDGFVTRIAVNIVNDVHEVRVSVESARQTGTVVFDVDGNIVEVDT